MCDITELEHCFCSKSKNFWLDAYEFITVLSMQWVLFKYDYCEGVGQFFVCLVVNTVIYWILLFFHVYFIVRIHCSCFALSEAECERLLLEEEKAAHKANQV